jgi:seryl-tRNA synthetase
LSIPAGQERPVSDQELRRTLEELRRELAGVEDVDAELEEMLSDIRADIDAVMEKSPPHSMTERLAQAVERFEATHPSLASAMGAVVDQLARLGI